MGAKCKLGLSPLLSKIYRGAEVLFVQWMGYNSSKTTLLLLPINV